MRTTLQTCVLVLVCTACGSGNKGQPDADDVLPEGVDVVTDGSDVLLDADAPVEATEVIPDPAADVDAPPEVECAVDGDCDDADPCTADTCDTGTGLCVHGDVDADDDGHIAAEVDGTDCGGDDCDDTRDDTFPGAPEGCDGTWDHDCDGDETDVEADADGDGHPPPSCAPTGVTPDCDDSDDTIYPGAPTTCDMVDDDCTGAWWDESGADDDGDRHLDETCGGDDCDDTEATIYTGATEICDMIDQDCDGSWADGGADDDGDGHLDETCGGDDCDDTVATIYTGATEICDAIDQDCDADLLDAPGADDDGDLHLDETCGGDDCDDTEATIYTGATEICDTIDQDCDADLLDAPGADDDGDLHLDETCGGDDCDDTVATIYTGATEICDTIDQDCDADVLDAPGADDDLDGYLDITCGGLDCDDAAFAVNPAATEVCDNVIDDDCDLALDCVDTDCAGHSACTSGTCSDPIIVPGTGLYTMSTVGFSNDEEGSCQTADGGEAVFSLTLTSASDVHIDTEGSDYDTVVHVRQTSCFGIELGCNDDVRGYDTWSRVDLRNLSAGTYIILADSTLPDTGGNLSLSIVVEPVFTVASLTVEDDPLVRMPGTQPADGVTIEGPSRCLNCHEGYDPAVEPGFNWKGSMMAQAARDPIFWATLAVAAQDSIWAVGRPNGVDLCERCHFPEGWLEGRSDPPDVSAMTGSDYDGVHCDFCHQLYDPFYEDTYTGVREGSDWLNYWDETNASSTPSSTAATDTYTEDAIIAGGISFFNGNSFYSSNQPIPTGYTENAGGQFYASPNGEKRASFADASARHSMLYSRHHKSKYACASCHDVSNPVLHNLSFEGTSPGDGVTVLPSEEDSAYAYFHVERTFSEFMLSAYGAPGGAAGVGPYDPSTFQTSLASNHIARCQDCHMADAVGAGADKTDSVIRPSGSTEHPLSGQPVHDLTGGNVFVSTILASTVLTSSNYDPVNRTLLNAGPSVLTMDLSQGEGIDPDAMLAGAARARSMLEDAATIQNVIYTTTTGDLSFRIRNNTGHKLLSGYPEGRRMFANIQVYSSGVLIHEVNPYDATIGTLSGLDPGYSPSSPALTTSEVHMDELVYEMHTTSSVTSETTSFHFVLATGRHKDNRIPPKGFDISSAPSRLIVPVWHGTVDPSYFTTTEYAGGHDDVSLTVPTGADRIEIRLYYQTTSREYMEFLRDELNGAGVTLPSPTLAGSAVAYIAQTDPFFTALSAWGDTIWNLWLHNKDMPGAAPILMTETSWP